MTLIITLLVAALLLFLFEFLLPGGILGIVGGILILVATGVAFNEYGAGAAALVLVTGLILGGLTILLEIQLIRKTKFGQRFIAQGAIEGSASGNADRMTKDLIGEEGVTLTKLVPTGKVEINGETYTASSRSGHVEAGVNVKVVELATFRLVVDPSEGGS